MSNAKNASSEIILDFRTLLKEKAAKCDQLEIPVEFIWASGELEEVIPDPHVEEIIKETEKEVDEIEFKVIGEAKFVQLRKIQVLPAWIASAKRFENDIVEKNLTSLKGISGFSRKLEKRIKEHISSFFPVQTAVLSYLMPLTNKTPIFPLRDVAIAAPTGSGKTLCYILPILNGLQHQDPSSVFAVVVAPSVLLEFKKYDTFKTSIVMLGSSQKYEVERARLFPNDTKLAKVSIIIATSDRLVQHLTDLDGKIDLSKLRYLVVDEADRMKNTAKMEWYNLLEERTHIFTPNSTSIDRLLLTNQNRWLQKILVSATLSLDAEKLFIWNLKCPKLFCADSVETEEPKKKEKKTVVDDTMAMDIDKDEFKQKPKPVKLKHAETISLPSTLKHKLIRCLPERKPLDVYCWIRQNSEWKKILIFVNSVLASKRLTKLLQLMFRDSKNIAQVNASIYNQKRLTHIKKLAEGKLDILVCTDNATRGLDVENIDCVINYDVPKENRTFIHRSGRTARAGKTGTVLTFTTRIEAVDFKKMLFQYGFMEKTEIVEPNDLTSAKDRSRYKKSLEELAKIFGTKEK